MKNNEVKQHLTELHYHEALDRLHIVMSLCNEHLMQHPVVKIETNIKNSVDDALKNLWEAYQLVGKISHERFD